MLRRILALVSFLFAAVLLVPFWRVCWANTSWERLARSSADYLFGSLLPVISVLVAMAISGALFFYYTGKNEVWKGLLWGAFLSGYFVLAWLAAAILLHYEDVIVPGSTHLSESIVLPVDVIGVPLFLGGTGVGFIIGFMVWLTRRNTGHPPGPTQSSPPS